MQFPIHLLQGHIGSEKYMDCQNQKCLSECSVK